MGFYDSRFECEYNDSLGQSSHNKGPLPSRVGSIHPRFGLPMCRRFIRNVLPRLVSSSNRLIRIRMASGLTSKEGCAGFVRINVDGSLRGGAATRRRVLDLSLGVVVWEVCSAPWACRNPGGPCSRIQLTLCLENAASRWCVAD